MPTEVVEQGPRDPDWPTLASLFAIVLIGGANGVAVKVGSLELAPYWAASIRFIAATLLLAVVAVITRHRTLHVDGIGVLAYGFLNFGTSYALLYLGLVAAPVGVAMVLLSTAPLATLLMASVVGLERLDRRQLLGGIIATIGTAIVFFDQIHLAIPVWSLFALLGSVLALSAASIGVKKAPPGDAIGGNVAAMAIGGTVLLAMSFFAGEDHGLPQSAASWLALAYLVVPGSVGLYALFLFVMTRWTASAVAFSFLPTPIIAIVLASVFLDEQIGATFLAGTSLILFGTLVGTGGVANLAH